MYRRHSRRDFVKVGFLGGLGLSLAQMLRHDAVAQAAPRGKSAIFIYLDGGQAHQDSWDLKPEGGDTAGEFRPIRTTIPELQVCEHMPRLAQLAHRYVVLRGVRDAIGVHGRGMSFVRSGNRPRESLQYPDIGSVMAKEFAAPPGVPPFVSLPVRMTNGSVESSGYLGVAYRAFAVNGDPSAADFSVRALQTPEGMRLDRVHSRLSLMQQLDIAYRELDLANQNLDGMDRFYQQAIGILQSPRTREAFDLSREAQRVRDRYGRTNLGQGCLLARRLIEVGVRCVTIDFGGWDTHQDNFKILKNDLLPTWDTALAALLGDLHERGLLEDTLVWSTGEMGRTPRINANNGRDHWGQAMSMMLAGAGLRGGQVMGRTDAQAAAVIADSCTPEDVAATALHALGIDHRKEYQTTTGRPIQIVRDGQVVGRLF